MAKKILIGSLQYSPIYKSLCCALGNQCEKYGYSVKYLFSFEYRWMLSEKLIKKTKFIANSNDIPSAIRDGLNYRYISELKQFISDFDPDYIYFHNYHPFFNYYVAKLARKKGFIFIQHVHEPYVEEKNVYKGIKRYWLYLFEFLQGRLLNETDIVILSSQRAMHLFNKRYVSFQGRKILAPLMYEDLGGLTMPLDRKYIIFIGPPVPSKSPELFLDIIDYSRVHHLNLNFLMITRKPIDDNQYSRENLTVFYKDKISDEEIGYYQRQSLMAITPYKVATQSSVVMTSFMYGTPVVSTDVGGIIETVDHLKTGYLLKRESSIKDWIEGITFVKDNFQNLSPNCRKYFTECFSENNWPKYFGRIFNHEKF